MRLRPGQPSVVPPVESALPGEVAEEPDAGRGKRLQDVPFGGGLEVRIGRPTARLNAPSTEQRVKRNGHDGWAITTADPVVAARPQSRIDEPVAAEAAVQKDGAARGGLC